MTSFSELDSYFSSHIRPETHYLADLHKDAEREKQAIAKGIRILRRRRV